MAGTLFLSTWQFLEEQVTGGLRDECRVKGLSLPETVENVIHSLLSEININICQLILDSSFPVKNYLKTETKSLAQVYVIFCI